jgi:hypothetical protein
MVNKEFRRVINAALLAFVYLLLKSSPFCSLLQLVGKVIFISVPKNISRDCFETVAELCFRVNIE